jgi:hypothetical protein
LGTWYVYHFDENLPDSLVDPGEPTQQSFRITIAVPERDARSSRHLYCYFPTEVELSLPLICHATVQLNPDRKHLINSGTNGYILQKLAERIADIAEMRANLSGNVDWECCRLIVPIATWSGDLLRLEFPRLLRTATKTRRLIPVLDGTICTIQEAQLCPIPDSTWLPIRHFPKVARTSDPAHWNLAMALEVAQVRQHRGRYWQSCFVTRRVFPSRKEPKQSFSLRILCLTCRIGPPFVSSIRKCGHASAYYST